MDLDAWLDERRRQVGSRGPFPPLADHRKHELTALLDVPSRVFP